MKRENNKKTLFDFIDLEDGDATVLWAQAQIVKDSHKARRARFAVMNTIHIENKGECQGCGDKNFVRWVDNEWYLCYDCYYEGMKQSGELYSYHGRRAEDMKGFIYDDEWEELWEKEKGVYEEEVLDAIKAFDVFEKQLGA